MRRRTQLVNRSVFAIAEGQARRPQHLSCCVCAARRCTLRSEIGSRARGARVRAGGVRLVRLPARRRHAPDDTRPVLGDARVGRGHRAQHAAGAAARRCRAPRSHRYAGCCTAADLTAGQPRGHAVGRRPVEVRRRSATSQLLRVPGAAVDGGSAALARLRPRQPGEQPLARLRRVRAGADDLGARRAPESRTPGCRARSRSCGSAGMRVAFVGFAPVPVRRRPARHPRRPRRS